MQKWLLISLICLFLPAVGFGFTFTVTPTAESCTGNGTLTFNPSNTDPGGTIVYEVYLLPDTTVPIATVSGNSITGLSAGDYRIIAKETTAGGVAALQQDVSIINSVVPLEFTVQSFNQACSSNSNITVDVTSGTGVSYEIFSGPVTFPPQTTNTFSGLPVGVYRIRVFDDCGTGVVSTFTVTVNPTGLTISPPSYTNTVPPSCNFTVVNHTITAATGTVIGYPLDIVFTVHPPGGGAPVIFNSTLTTGSLSSEQISETIPYFVNQNYDYDLSITDACGSVFSGNFPVNQNITLSPVIFQLQCNSNYFKLNTTNFTPPFSLNFTITPAGFNPVDFNSDYPGPFTDGTVQFGSTGNTTPFGNYEVTISDLCGRTTTLNFWMIPVPPNPIAIATNNGCTTNSGKISISIFAFKIITAIITAAPASYPFPLPHDVTATIDSSGDYIILDPVPVGDYTFVLSDECGDTLNPLNVTVPPWINQGMDSELRPGCELQKSGIRVSSKNVGLSSIAITAAPTAFSHPLPYDGVANIALDGSFYMNGLPEGSYTFSGTDICGFSNTITVNVLGYAITSSTFSLQKNCGSFDIPLNFVSNGIAGQSFWLQKLIDPITDTWGHPGTDVAYAANTVPNATNSYFLVNNTTNYNLIFNGTFRIIRTFSNYINGSELLVGGPVIVDKNCIEILSPTLFFDEVLEITDAYRMPCSSSGSLDIVIEANGSAPLHYTIIEKDGLPFSFDNGNSNIFYNLAGGIYTFKVEDNCGNSVNRIFDVNTLLSLITATKPNDIVQCQNTITGNEQFDLTVQSPIILGTQSTTDHTLTYHTSLADAQNNLNAIANLSTFVATSNPQTIYARLIYNPLPNCYEITSFDLFTGQNPFLNLSPTYVSCAAIPVTLDASPNNLPTTSYLWSDATTSPTITISQLGTTNLTITATNTYGLPPATCSSTTAISVTISEAPVLDHIEIHDWTYDENSITVFTTNNGAFEYSIDGFNYQDQSTFTNLKAGLYTVYVRDKYQCGFFQQEIWLLYYPNFFTPNNDGYNDMWFIQNSDKEPDLDVAIFDRYGKLITYLDSKNKNWDGQYNDNQAVSTDYWFVVHRQDGRVHKGHFTLKR